MQGFAAFSVGFGGLGCAPTSVAVSPVAVGCKEGEAGLLGYGRQLQLVVGVGAGSVACPALRRHVFPLRLALHQVPPLLSKSFISHKDQKSDEGADVSAVFFLFNNPSPVKINESLFGYLF